MRGSSRSIRKSAKSKPGPTVQPTRVKAPVVSAACQSPAAMTATGTRPRPCGPNAIRCESPEDLDKVIEEANSINDRPVVVDFVVHEDAMVWPMVAAGTSNDEIMAARDVRPDFGDNEDD